MSQINVLSGATHHEQQNRDAFTQLLRESPIPDAEILQNLGLYLNRQTLSRILFMQQLYAQIVPVHGVIMEFGVRWGQNLALFENFRGMYEPFNYNRRIVGFDTFEGFPHVDSKDGSRVAKGDYSVTQNYKAHLEDVLNYHESESPVAHKRKYELVAGDVMTTVDAYFEEHPETIVALAYFDFDLYTPTKKCLEALKGRLTKGSILAFDELNTPEFPGETRAVQEVLGLDRYALRRSPLTPLCSWLVIE